MANVLVLWSGGKDSLLTACRVIEDGDKAVLFSCNCGSLTGEENLVHGADRIRERCGPDAVRYAGVYPTAGILQGMDHIWSGTPLSELARDYPGLTNSQARCLHCQSAMWIAAIAYARAKGIQYIAAGYKSHDVFCTGMDAWTGIITSIALRFSVKTRFPLWETPEWGADKKTGRDLELLNRGFSSKILEPKCMAGRPAEKPGDAAENDVIRFFRTVIAPDMPRKIERLIPVIKTTQLTAKATI